MSRLMENVVTINSAVRTLLLVIFFVAVGLAIWLGYKTFYADELAAEQREQEYQTALRRKQDEIAARDLALAERDETIRTQAEENNSLKSENQSLTKTNESLRAENTEVKQENAELTEENIQLATSVRLLKFNHRLAEVTVLDVTKDEQSGETMSRIEFVEIDNSGKQLEKPRVFNVPGEIVYIDNWVVKFDDKYIEQATDLDRATSLCLFRRIFGESQKPREGFQLDQTGMRPHTYDRGGRITELERKIWEDFWAIANDSDRARELGIRALHGEAVSFKAVKGKHWVLQLRASDGLTLLPATDASASTLRPAA